MRVSFLAERWVGIVVSGKQATLVDAEVVDGLPPRLQNDFYMKLQSGNRAEALAVMSQQITNYLRENGIERVVVKGSSAGKTAMKLSHLESAELRGVVISSAASVCDTSIKKTGVISRTYGSRKAKDYIEDDEHWNTHFDGDALKKGSREAALLLLAERED